jgi:type IV secretion system protein VirB9
MKKVAICICTLCGLLLSSQPAAWSAQAAQTPATAQDQALFEHELQRELGRSQGIPAARDLPDYFSSKKIPLTKAEQAALSMAQSWARNPSQPIRLANGKIAFLYGASIPSIIASPFNIVDMEFEPGENVQAVLLGDTARWQVESGAVGIIPHVFIKPVDTGLETSAIITTSRRVYHLRLISQRQGFMPYVGFIYPEHSLAKLRLENERREKREYFDSAPAPGATGREINLASLDFNYKINGSARWKPVQVFSDSDKTYIKLPEKIQEMPVLLARSKDEILINYRIENNVYIVDGVFPEMLLILGAGSRQEKITIRKL